MKKTEFLKVVLVAGLMASASCMNSNAVTASKPKAEVVECVAQQTVQDSMVYLKWGTRCLHTWYRSLPMASEITTASM